MYLSSLSCTKLRNAKLLLSRPVGGADVTILNVDNVAKLEVTLRGLIALPEGLTDAPDIIIFLLWEHSQIT